MTSALRPKICKEMNDQNYTDLALRGMLVLILVLVDELPTVRDRREYEVLLALVLLVLVLERLEVTDEIEVLASWPSSSASELSGAARLLPFPLPLPLPFRSGLVVGAVADDDSAEVDADSWSSMMETC
jgi:hypothetical protein